MTNGHQFPPSLDRAYPVVDGRIQTRSLEAHVVDHCNLTCADCCSLSPLLPAWQVSPGELARDLARVARVLAPRVFKLVGGEPLLHPALVELVEITRRSNIAPRISITTNGLLLARTPDALWQAIDALTISLYPRPAMSAEAIAAIEARAARFGVALNWKRQSHFVVMDRAARCADAAETQAIYDPCWLRERCHMLRAGRFYTCTRPPHLQTLRPELDLAGDGLDLERSSDDAELRGRVLAYLQREQPLETCAHCLGGNAAMTPHRLLTRAELVRSPR
jgi:hypothetical protein